MSGEKKSDTGAASGYLAENDLLRAALDFLKLPKEVNRLLEAGQGVEVSGFEPPASRVQGGRSPS